MSGRLVRRGHAALRARLPDATRRRLGAFWWERVRRQADLLGFELVRRGYYSALPQLDELSDEVWTRRSPLEGIEFDLGRQLRLIADELGAFIAEFDPTFETGRGPYRIRNGAYDEVDSELLYAMVRHLRPRRVVELGSGFSTLVLARACEVNRAEGVEVDYRVFDPHPTPVSDWPVPGVRSRERTRAQDLPLSVFDELDERDILFVDTTHTVKIGSDVNRVVLDVLPRLRPGVVVQFHDIFLPWEYHRSWIEGEWKWNEQYLLQAFLAMNPRYEVLISAHALMRDHPRELAALIPTTRPESAPSAFWIRVRNE